MYVRGLFSAAGVSNKKKGESNPNLHKLKHCSKLLLLNCSLLPVLWPLSSVFCGLHTLLQYINLYKPQLHSHAQTPIPSSQTISQRKSRVSHRCSCTSSICTNFSYESKYIYTECKSLCSQISCSASGRPSTSSMTLIVTQKAMCFLHQLAHYRLL